MFEIELKAWVKEKEKVRDMLLSIAKRERSFQKIDDYYHKDDAQSPVTVRIRHEKEWAFTPCNDEENDSDKGNVTSGNRETLKEVYFFTYKKKELKEGLLEVNDEKECTISSPVPLLEMLETLDFSHSLHKEKRGELFTLERGNRAVNADFCEVSGLGTFLELEVLSESREPSVVSRVKEILENTLEECGVGRENIEPRYYKDLLVLKGESECLT